MVANAQYVTLGIDREIFAIPIQNVQEILDMQDICKLPYATAGLVGIIDVRGRAIPVIDLRTKLGIAALAASPNTRILVLQIGISD